MLRKGYRMGLPLLLVLLLALSATALADRPAKPTNIVALAFLDEDRVGIYWTDPEEGAPITSYEISLDGSTWTNIGLVYSYEFTGLDMYNNYSDLYVRAVNADGAGATGELGDYWPVEEVVEPRITGPGYFPRDLTGYKVLSSPLEVRAGAGTEFEVIDTLPTGTMLKWIDWDGTGNWWRLMYNDGQSAGWVLRTTVRWKNAAYPEYR